MVNGIIVTAKGNKYPMPNDAIELMNLIYDIINGQEKSTKIAPNIPSTRRASSCPEVTDDTLYHFALYQSSLLGKGEEHAAKLYSCIYGALLIGKITIDDITMENDLIKSINKINLSVPCLC